MHANEDIYHEKETVILRSPTTVTRAELDTFLTNMGLRAEDYFYVLPLSHPAPPWQSTSVAVIDVYLDEDHLENNDEDIMEGTAADWNALHLHYFMASLPSDCIEQFLELASSLVDRFGLTMVFHDSTVDIPGLRGRLEEIADELTREFGGPGSESLAILIELTYPKH